MELIAYSAILLVGVVLAIIGGGGSILTVPILVYLFKLPADISTSYSLFLVGISAAVGAVRYGKEKLIAYKIGIIFAAPAFIGVFSVRKFLMPLIPKSFEIMSLAITKDQLILLTFSSIMLLVSISMIRTPKKKSSFSGKKKTLNVFIISLEGLLVGAVTGFVGAGGGFLIIPALVLFAGLSMETAVGTSLMIIAIKSFLGFTGDIGTLAIDWKFLGVLSMISIVGIVIGGHLAKRIKPGALKPLFGYFVLIMGFFIIFQQLWV